MKEHFRQSMAWLHTWAGLVTGWVLFFIFVIGTATYFHMEITRWMRPELPLRPAQQTVPTTQAVQTAFGFLARQSDSATGWQITLPNDGRRIGCGEACGSQQRGYSNDLTVSWSGLSERLDAVTREALPPPPAVRETEGGMLFYEVHYQLHYIDAATGMTIVSIATLLSLLVLITGIVVHKNIFKDFFTFRPSKGQRSWLDGHNLSSVMALPFFVMIVYSGLALQSYMPKPLLHTPKPVQPAQPTPHEAVPVKYADVPIVQIVEHAERMMGSGEIGSIKLTQLPEHGPLIEIQRPHGVEWPLKSRYGSHLYFNATTGELLDIPYTFGQKPAHQALWFFTIFHMAWFAGTGLRWLLFLSGLLGCVMIGTGMVLWAVKRREKQARLGNASFGLRLVERLNIGVLVGLPVGVAAYFWANRLLPVTMFERAEWEAHCLFLTWAWVLLYAALRPVKKAWLETLWLATAAFVLIPVLNWLTTDKHLGATISHGDWVLAGLDLTMLALATVFGFIAWKLRRKWASIPATRADATPARVGEARI
ncbi:MAG: PepSY domain-containing protein [Rhodocyclaceae bacterium]|nr:PepSY domain-containing protein [Rhodocyclaceae bacterium]